MALYAPTGWSLGGTPGSQYNNPKDKPITPKYMTKTQRDTNLMPNPGRNPTGGSIHAEQKNPGGLGWQEALTKPKTKTITMGAPKLTFDELEAARVKAGLPATSASQSGHAYIHEKTKDRIDVATRKKNEARMAYFNSLPDTFSSARPEKRDPGFSNTRAMGMLGRSGSRVMSSVKSKFSQKSLGTRALDLGLTR